MCMPPDRLIKHHHIQIPKFHSSIDMGGDNPATIQQSVPTVNGNYYQIVFQYSLNVDGGSYPKTMDVSWCGTKIGAVTINKPAPSKTFFTFLDWT